MCCEVRLSRMQIEIGVFVRKELAGKALKN